MPIPSLDADAAISARFPAPAEDAAEPQPWAAEGATAPEGPVTMDGLKAWARVTFGYGAAALAGDVDLKTLGRCADAAEDNLELDDAMASGLYAACVALMGHAIPPPPEE